MTGKQKTNRIERVTLTGPLDAMREALEWCYQRGYTVLSRGPKPTGRIGECDRHRYQIVAQLDTIPDQETRGKSQ